MWVASCLNMCLHFLLWKGNLVIVNLLSDQLFYDSGIQETEFKNIILVAI